ncbi:asparagine synthase (glutamine-hydrolyzing) [Bacteroidota bacterium]
MCGITGLMAFNEAGRFHMINLQRSIELLSSRGPDAQGSLLEERVALGHRRLAVIDPTPEANQPMSDSTGRYTIVYNGEVYNFGEIKQELESKGVVFKTHSDTEVVLEAYVHYGEKCLQKFNGFFSFCIFDKEQDELFLARDRYGIKPLYYFQDEDKFLFASELKSLMAYGFIKSINFNALYFYLQLNYIPAPLSILNGVHKLYPGNIIRVSKGRFETEKYYSIPTESGNDSQDYQDQKEKIVQLLDDSVRHRLISDVPLGVFLSGGIDSSVITALASRHTDNLKTFSIGYKDQPFFDETRYSRLVSSHFDTDHTEYQLGTYELYQNLDNILEYIDEPFADSSAIPAYLLSQYTGKEVTVALSGDGADELFGGYNKHMAFHKSLNRGLTNTLIKYLYPVAGVFPASRNNRWGNKLRQIRRYGSGLNMDLKDRYWHWAVLNSENKALRLLSDNIQSQINFDDYHSSRANFLDPLDERTGINSILTADLMFVLPNDMLFKVDSMSMANSLEVRVPFLDHHLVEYVHSIQGDHKVNNKMKKRILQDAFREILPAELYKRPKQGFEVPLLGWFRTELKSLIMDDLLEMNFIRDQGIFNEKEIARYRRKLFSLYPGDIQAHIWGLIVFQSWWKKYFS